MFSEKRTQIGQTSLNLREPRWTLRTKVSRSFELSGQGASRVLRSASSL